MAAALLVSPLMISACQSTARPKPPAEVAEAAPVPVHTYGYAILYTTLEDEARLDKILILKRPSPQVADLIKAIAQFARDSKKSLDALAKETPAIDLQDQGLPEAETKTRESISSATSKQLLGNSGGELEFRLLLTQHEALNYITNLATVLGKEESREDRKQILAQIARGSAALHEQVLAQAKTPYVGRAK
jgi:hypothetical protein